MKVYIHYNGYDFAAPDPQLDRWNNYTNPDSAKMFLVCADSWARNGWKPVRLDSSLTRGFEFVGKLSGKRFEYPLECWNIWFQLEQLAKNGPIVFTTTDVLNNGLKPKSLTIPALDIGVSFNRPWSNSCMVVTEKFCEFAIDRIYSVDAGTYELPKCEIITDEAIMREWGSAMQLKLDYTSIACITRDWQEYPLIHYPRSSLARGLQYYDVYEK
jgi:hypothetical protein